LFFSAPLSRGFFIIYYNLQIKKSYVFFPPFEPAKGGGKPAERLKLSDNLGFVVIFVQNSPPPKGGILKQLYKFFQKHSSSSPNYNLVFQKLGEPIGHFEFVILTLFWILSFGFDWELGFGNWGFKNKKSPAFNW